MDISIENNIFYNNGNSNAPIYSGSATVQNNIVGNPLFVSSSDFHLQSSSPAINKGLNVGLTSDYAGNSISGTPDIGAYEYGGVLGASTYNFTQTLKYGSTGNEVMELQKKLIADGYLTVTPNGNFGPATENAVKAYQKANSLASDGVVGQKTRELLNKNNTNN